MKVQIGCIVTFVQVMTFEADDIAPIQQLMADWNTKQADVAPGYKSNRILKDREQGTFLIEVEFASAEQAATNNDRPETAEYANRLNALTTGEVGFSNYDVV